MLPPRGRIRRGLAPVSPGLLCREMGLPEAPMSPHSSLRTVIENCPHAVLFFLSKGLPGLKGSLGHAPPMSATVTGLRSPLQLLSVA